MRNLVICSIAAALSMSAGSARAYQESLECSVQPPARVSAMPRPLENICAIPQMRRFGPPDITDSGAAQAYRWAQVAIAEKDWAMAAIQLRLVEFAFPRIADRISLELGEAYINAGLHERAIESVREAIKSDDPDIVVKATQLDVQARLLGDARDAEEKLRALILRYPSAPNLIDLQLELARFRFRRGQKRGAVMAYRRVIQNDPASTAAADADAALRVLESQGVRVWGFSSAERVAKLEHLVRHGPFERARVLLDELRNDKKLGSEQRGRMWYAAGRLARVEGRWNDASRNYHSAKSAGVADAKAKAANLHGATDKGRSQARARLAKFRRGKAWSKLRPFALATAVEIAVMGELKDELEAILNAAIENDRISARAKLDYAIQSIGLADRNLLISVFTDARSVLRGESRLRASYYLARLLETIDATRSLNLYAGITSDDDANPWYRILASQRATMVEAARCREGCGKLSLPIVFEPTPLSSPTNIIATKTLDELAQKHGDNFPQLARAADFLRIGAPELASEAIYEVYLLYRHSIGRRIPRAGLYSVARADNRSYSATWKQKAERRSLSKSARTALANVARQLGDYGTWGGFLGGSAVQQRPKPYEQLVQAAAARHGLDPALLFAVMRVESVYQPHIVSYAGAIGLAQIMPRTGRFIADARGIKDFDVSDLLEPATNLDFAAWYLTSLIKRFDGHIPLAIASYNGGPHNVRRWLRNYPEAMPMDAFLEQIPFTQTHRYVRRVLTHYAAYRAKDGHGPVAIGFELPKVGIDKVGF